MSQQRVFMISSTAYKPSRWFHDHSHGAFSANNGFWVQAAQGATSA
jgi:hypothetical protein